MSSTATVRVDLGTRSYDIVVGEQLLAEAASWLRPVLRHDRVIMITDQNVAKTAHFATLTAALDAAQIATQTIAVPAGEGTKSAAQLEQLLDDILALGIERQTTLLALGGGVIGDLAGFAAAILLRGLDYVQVPTTLLAQVDSAVGGKTGINSRHGKNLIGSFHQPRLVLCDTAVLNSLPARELRAGYAEVVKYGLINQPDFFAWLEERGEALLHGDADLRRHAVVTSCAAKAEIVASDEREGGARALLNLGHTFGHALERITGYGDELLHGEAVAIGCVMAFRLSAALGLCLEEDAQRAARHFESVGLPTSLETLKAKIAPSELIQAMTSDKKAEGGVLRFVLARGIGRAFAGAVVERDRLERFLGGLT